MVVQLSHLIFSKDPINPLWPYYHCSMETACLIVIGCLVWKQSSWNGPAYCVTKMTAELFCENFLITWIKQLILHQLLRTQNYKHPLLFSVFSINAMTLLGLPALVYSHDPGSDVEGDAKMENARKISNGIWLPDCSMHQAKMWHLMFMKAPTDRLLIQ